MPHKRSLKGKYNQQIRHQTHNEKIAETDAIRGIITENCTRDLVTGEIAYKTKNLKQIQTALSDAQYSIEITVTVNGMYEKHIRRRPEKYRLQINKEKASQYIAQLIEGEVRNRFGLAAMILAARPEFAAPNDFNSELSDEI